MMRVFSYLDYIIMGLLRIFYSITLNVLPLILWFFLRGIATVSEISYTSTLPLVIGIAVVSVARSLCVGHALFKAEIMAVRLKAAMAGLVYKKASNVKLKGNSKRLTHGSASLNISCSANVHRYLDFSAGAKINSQTKFFEEVF